MILQPLKRTVKRTASVATLQIKLCIICRSGESWALPKRRRIIRNEFNSISKSSSLSLTEIPKSSSMAFYVVNIKGCFMGKVSLPVDEYGKLYFGHKSRSM